MLRGLNTRVNTSIEGFCGRDRVWRTQTVTSQPSSTFSWYFGGAITQDIRNFGVLALPPF